MLFGSLSKAYPFSVGSNICFIIMESITTIPGVHHLQIIFRCFMFLKSDEANCLGTVNNRFPGVDQAELCFYSHSGLQR